LPESSLSGTQASDAVLTSRGLQTRLPIGPAQCLGHLHSANVDISARFDEFGQLSIGFCGDNLVADVLIGWQHFLHCRRDDLFCCV